MKYPILLYGNPILNTPCKNCVKEQIEASPIISNMFETMEQASGVGLAAPQVGLSLRLFVVDTQPVVTDEPPLRQVFINPVILHFSAESEMMEEGCLSIPGIHEEVARPQSITLTYLNDHFEEVEESFEGFAARVIQHEYDHIEGKLFLDYIHPLKKKLLKNKLSKIQKGIVDVKYPTKV